MIFANSNLQIEEQINVNGIFELSVVLFATFSLVDNENNHVLPELLMNFAHSHHGDPYCPLLPAAP